MKDREHDSQSAWNSSSVHVIDKELLGSRTVEIVRELHAGAGKPDPRDPFAHDSAGRQLTLEAGNGRGVAGLRKYVPESIGQGYWDFIAVCPGLILSITDAAYRRPHRITLPAENLIKLRVVCAGSLTLSERGEKIGAGSVVIQRRNGDTPASYYIKGNLVPLRMVVLHASPDALPKLGIQPEVLATELRALLDLQVASDAMLRFEPNAKILRIATDITDSRHRLISEIRQTYVRGKSYELLCEMLLRAGPLHDQRSGGNRFRRSDIVRLYEARRIVANDLESSPTIDQLSRLVGINRTKLKSGFRKVFGESIKEYRMRVRMAEAIRLLEETDIPLAEVGRRIGYVHAANFSQVVKRQLGRLPLAIRKRTDSEAACRANR